MQWDLGAWNKAFQDQTVSVFVVRHSFFDSMANAPSAIHSKIVGHIQDLPGAVDRFLAISAHCAIQDSAITAFMEKRRKDAGVARAQSQMFAVFVAWDFAAKARVEDRVSASARGTDWKNHPSTPGSLPASTVALARLRSPAV